MSKTIQVRFCPEVPLYRIMNLAESGEVATYIALKYDVSHTNIIYIYLYNHNHDYNHKYY